jgi:hypothetical protein
MQTTPARRGSARAFATLCAAAIVPVACALLAPEASTSAAAATAARPRIVATVPSPGAFDASGLVAGDRAERLVTVSNPSRTGFSRIAFYVRTSGLPLATATTTGLQMRLERCSAPWRSTGARTSCRAKRAVLFGPTPVRDTQYRLRGLATARAGGRDHLRVVVSLPASATNDMQGAVTTISYLFAGTA